MRVRDSQVELERKHLVRLAKSSRVAQGGRLQVGLWLKRLQGSAASGLAQSSSLASAAWQRARPWFAQPAAAE
ncbi:hypothetical protein ACFLTC_02310 [Chloroflexota bacterium]